MTRKNLITEGNYLLHIVLEAMGGRSEALQSLSDSVTIRRLAWFLDDALKVIGRSKSKNAPTRRPRRKRNQSDGKVE
jgi:hypothetical protein